VQASMESQFRFERKKQIILAIAVGLVVLLALLGLRSIKLTNDIKVMLPQQENILQTFDFFRKTPLAGNVFVSFEIKDSKEFPKLISAVDQFSASLDTSMIKSVVTGTDGVISYDGIREFVRLAPQLMSEEELNVLDARLNGPFIHKVIKKLYRDLLSPSGLVMKPVIEQDPLGFQKETLAKLRNLATNMKHNVEIRNGHLISRDGCHALVILETDISITEGVGAKELIRYIEDSLLKLPTAVSADLIAGHLHSLSNERVIKRDVFVTIAVASIGFLALFLFLFKDIKALLLFMVPIVSVLISILICSWILGEFSYIIMGMGALISGIAIDYCIHVYVAMRSGQTRQVAMGEITMPIMIGALTTVCVYSVFLFSRIPGYRELALFTVISILLSLGFAILLLPHFLTNNPGKVEKYKLKFRWTLNIPDKYVILIWSILLGSCLLLLPFVNFNTDVRQYDGSEESIFQTEDKFDLDWGVKDRPAMIVVEAPSFNEALEINYQIQQQVDLLFDNESYNSISRVWLPERVRHENLVRWSSFWNETRYKKLKDYFQTYSTQYGFEEDAFDPFFKMLYLDPEKVKAFEELSVLKLIKPRFAFETNQGYQIVNFFEDSEKLVGKVSQESKNWPDAFVVSANQFKQLLSEAILSETTFLSLIIVIVIPLLTFIFLKNVYCVLIALVPAVSSVLVTLGMFTMFKITLNAASIFALLVVGGLSIDYGIFMVYQCYKQLKSDTRMAVTLSALTTLFGAGTLVVTKHPVLFYYGITMVLGILSGYFSAVFVVPSLYRLIKQDVFLTEPCQTV
jgi:uncharacterized protein